MTKREAILKLLGHPDPPDLVRGTPQLTVAGKPDRGTLHQSLPMRFVVITRVERDNAIDPSGLA